MTRAPRVRPSALAAILLIVGFALLPAFALAQLPTLSPDAPPADDTFRDWTDEVPAHVSHAVGNAWLHRDGAADDAPVGVPLLAGDLLRTRQGRLEVLFADGSVLSLDEETDAELLADNLLRLTRGRVRLDLGRAAGSVGYRVDANGTTTWIRAAGEYRIELRNRDSSAPEVRLLVGYGLAEISANGGRTLVRTGHEAFGSADTTPSMAYAVTVTRWDAFDRWWDARRVAQTTATSSNAQYLPPEIASYSAVLENDGDWEYDTVYGYVWYPTVVDTWYPYSVGRWSFVGHYGWTWIGHDRWAWPTHHYGRWGHSGRGYYWIPGRHWAPAWVGWASGPGYIGWSPLGYHNRPIVPVHVGATSGWRGWTHVPARRFTTGAVVAGRDRSTPPRGARFSSYDRGPGRPSTLPARETAGIRGPGQARPAVALPRGGAGRPQSLDRNPVANRQSNGPWTSGSDGNLRVPSAARDRRGPASDAPASSPAATPGRRPGMSPAVTPARSTGSRATQAIRSGGAPVTSPGMNRAMRPASIGTGRSRAGVVGEPPTRPVGIGPGESAGSDSSPRTVPRRAAVPATRPAVLGTSRGGRPPQTETERAAPTRTMPEARSRSSVVNAPSRGGGARPAARSAAAPSASGTRAVPRGRD
jgi:hypothetical protein